MIVFVIPFADMNNIPRITGGDKFELHVSGPVETYTEIMDNRDGTYEVTLKTSVPGKYQLYVTLRDQPLPQCPICFSVVPRMYNLFFHF